MWSTAGACLSEICKKLNADELKLRLIEAWLIQQSVADQAIDQWRVCLNACVKAKGNDVLYHNCQ